MPITASPPCDFPSLRSFGSIYDISDDEFALVRRLTHEKTGISLSPAKRSLVCARLAKRLRDLELDSYGEYLEYLARRDPKGEELQRMINCLTTNKTEFFREPHHFQFLRNVVFPEVRQRMAKLGTRRLRFWSAGCSTGNEAYSIAITILEHFGSRYGWDIKILASDIDTDVLRKGETGIYPADDLCMPDEIRRKYFLRGTGQWLGHCQIRPEVRQLVSFRQINLTGDAWPQLDRFDVIFCRNTIIYFDDATQRKLLPRLADRLQPGGFLMLGHSENLPWIAPRFACLGGTIHQLRTANITNPVPRAAGNCGAVEPVLVASLKGDAAGREPKPSAPAAATLQRKPAVGPHRRSTRALPRHGQRGQGLPQHTIIVGETFASRTPIEINTTLGSCVAACLFDPVTGIGGMNHFMLPGARETHYDSARYGVHAMELLINEIMKHGGDRRRLQAKAFGGANLMPLNGLSPNIGGMNIRFIRDFLDVERIPLLAERLGGQEPMRVIFTPHTGQAFVKMIGKPQVVALDEARFARRYEEQIRPNPQTAVTLF
jgi:chemotaxis protein methyltransferase CheR